MILSQYGIQYYMALPFVFDLFGLIPYLSKRSSPAPYGARCNGQSVAARRPMVPDLPSPAASSLNSIVPTCPAFFDPCVFFPSSLFIP